ncbi:MAG: hypothetical protein ACTHLT_11830 [Devosia sp.]
MTDSNVVANTAPAAIEPATDRPISDAVIYALVALIALGTTWFHLSGPLGPDVSWLITVSERILAGGRLYVDILEPNPPMAGYLYMPPVLLARALGLPSEPFVVLWTVGFGLLTTGFAARLVTRHRLLQHPELFWPVTLLLFLSAWGEDFAQREHFAAMAGLPLVVSLALRATGNRPPLHAWIMAGLAGGFMLAIKPHFALPILFGVLYVAWRRRSLTPVFAPEMWLAGSLFVAFCVATVVFYPEFLSNILPVATTVYIPDRRPLWLLLSVRATAYFEVILLIALIGFRRHLTASPLLGVMFAAAIGFLLSYLAQGKGYPYQILPGTALIGSFVLLGFSEQRDTTRRLLDSVLPIAAAAVLAIMPMLDDVGQWRGRQPLEDAIRPYGPGLRIANITPDLTVGSPLHRRLGAELINAPPSLLMSISAWRLRIERHPDAEWAAKIDAFEAAERRQLRSDMQARPPDIVVSSVDGFDWLAWAREDPDLASILAGYEQFGIVTFFNYDLVLLKRRGLEPGA